MRFEFIVALRYLRARRKQAVVSLVTVIAVVGVTAGVAALVIALAINRGFTEDLRGKLLGARAAVTLVPAEGTGGVITNYREVVRQVEAMEGVVSASPAYYVFVLIQGRFGNQGAYVKGIVPELEPASSPFVGAVSEGSSEGFEGQRILLGREAYLYLGTLVGEPVRLLSGRTARDPYFGYAPIEFDLTVAGAFETGLYDFDKGYAFVPIRVAQRLDDRGDVATHVEVEIADLDQSDVLAPVLARETGLDAEEWKDQNRAIFEALKLERLVMFITIGLIVIVASLNIVVTLVMMVMEKARDIAILTAMGATGEAIRRIFVVQGVVIGVLGTALGLVLGNTTAWVADAYRLVSLSEQVYSIAYVPFEINLADSLIVGAGAIFISWASTIYPSRRAAALQPVEAFRYE